MAAPSPSGSLPPVYPLRFSGQWQRNWRLGTELVDTAHIVFTLDGISFSGRRTNPIRGLLWLLFDYGWTLTAWATFLSVCLTCMGVTWRACVTSPPSSGGCAALWVWLGPLVAIPALWFFGWMFRWIFRRWFEPWVSEQVPWAKVGAVATDGTGIDIRATGSFGSFHARLAPERAGNLAAFLAAVRDRRLPGDRGGLSGSLIRSRWIDRGLGLGLSGAVLYGAVCVEPILTGRMISTERPEDAMPTAMTARARDARSERACAGATGAGGVTAQREGRDLVWQVSGRPSGGLSVLRMKAGDSRFQVHSMQAPTPGRIPSFFQDGDAGVVVLTAPGLAAGQLLGSGRVEDLAGASCAGLVVDVALAGVGGVQALKAVRDSDDLRVSGEGISGPGRLVVVRRLGSARGELFRWCEVATTGDQLRSVVATSAGSVFPGIFSAADQDALVYFVPVSTFEAASRLATGGSVQRCLSVESLVAGGLVAAQAEVRSSSGHAQLRWKTGQRARATAMFAADADARAVLAGVAARYDEVRRELAPSDSQENAFNEAFFAAVDWTALFDRLNFAGDMALIEGWRKQIAGTGGEDAGAFALLALGSAFLERFPPPADRLSARFQVGKAWLDAPKTLKLRGDDAELWRIVGRFVLNDIGRRLEDDINGGRLGYVDLARSSYLIARLSLEGVRIDIKPSTTRKVLVAWVTGDFGYLLDRAAKKLAEWAGGTSAFTDARYRLDSHGRTGVHIRHADLIQDGDRIGWVALYDAQRVRARWVVGNEVPASADLAMSAAFTESNGVTTGLAIQRGAVHNWLWKPDMGGMVVLSGRGQVSLLDLRRGGLLWGLSLSPGRSLMDFHRLIQSVREEGGAAFQTYLLAGSGELRLNPDRASQEIRERRLLATASYRGNPILAVVDLPRGGFRQGYTLYQAAQVVMDALQTAEKDGGPGLVVNAVANLDTGARDVLVVRQGGQLVQRSPLGLPAASNLFVVAAEPTGGG